jgi:hypothetical protein
LVPPNTQLARIFTCVYALAGVACLGVALGVLGNRMVELESKAMHYYEQDVMTLFASQTTTSKDNDITCKQESREISREICKDMNELKRRQPHLGQEQQRIKPGKWRQIWNRMGGKWYAAQHLAIQNFLQPSTPYNDYSVVSGASCSTSACKRRKVLYQKLHSSPSQQHHSLPRFLQHINIRLTIYLALLLGLSYWIGHDAGWDFSQTLYFAITTSCTIGYGDKVPTSQGGRLAVVAFIPFAVGAMGYFLQQVAEVIVRSKQQRSMGMLFGTASTSSSRRQAQRQRQRELTVMDLEAMDTDGDGNVDWSEFLEFMLVAMRKVDEDLLWQLRFQFDSLDVDDTGVLSKQNLICMARRKLQHSSYKLKLGQYKQHLLKKTGSSISASE